MTETEAYEMIHKIEQWYHTKADMCHQYGNINKNGELEAHGWTYGQLMQMVADVGHSSLLKRILMGEEIAQYPPPLAYSYPVTLQSLRDLEEGKILDVGEVYYREDYFHTGKSVVVINQSPWDVIRKIGNGEYVVHYKLGQQKYHPLVLVATISTKRDDGKDNWDGKIKKYTGDI